MSKRFNKSSIAITSVGVFMTISGLLINFLSNSERWVNLSPDIFGAGLVFALVPLIKWLLDLLD